jgi:hypothetical protein
MDFKEKVQHHSHLGPWQPPLPSQCTLIHPHLSATTKPPFTKSGKASSCLMTLPSRKQQESVVGCPIFELTTNFFTWRNLPQLSYRIDPWFLHTPLANNLQVSKYQHGDSITIFVNWVPITQRTETSSPRRRSIGACGT